MAEAKKPTTKKTAGKAAKPADEVIEAAVVNDAPVPDTADAVEAIPPPKKR